MVHLGLSVASVLLSHLEKIKALLERCYRHFMKAFDCKVLFRSFNYQERLNQLIRGLIKQIVQLVVINFEVGAPQIYRFYLLSFFELLYFGEHVAKTVN
jgi:hypothetical protein